MWNRERDDEIKGKGEKRETDPFIKINLNKVGTPYIAFTIMESLDMLSDNPAVEAQAWNDGECCFLAMYRLWPYWDK